MHKALPSLAALLLLAPGCGPLTGSSPYIALDTEQLYLPGAAQDRTSEAQLTLYNLGGGALRLSQLRLVPLGMARGWTLDQAGPVELPPDAALALTIRHRHDTPDAPARGRLLLHSNDLARPVVTVELYALGCGSNLSANPGRVDFGAVATGRSSTRTVRIVNLGTATARGLELTWSGPDHGGDFSAALPAGALPSAGALDLQLTYTPHDGGSDAATLQLRWQEGENGTSRSLKLPLSGRQDLQAPD